MARVNVLQESRRKRSHPAAVMLMMKRRQRPPAVIRISFDTETSFEDLGARNLLLVSRRGAVASGDATAVQQLEDLQAMTRSGYGEALRSGLKVVGLHLPGR